MPRIARLLVVALLAAAAACDTRIVEAAQARVTIAVPLPAIASPDGAPPLTADLEVPGRVAAPSPSTAASPAAPST